MSEQVAKYHKKEIAAAQLRTAVSLFLNGKDLSFWCNPEKLDRRLKEGYKIYYEKDTKTRRWYRFINKYTSSLLVYAS